MGLAAGTDHKRSPNVELNIVPLIDLMSCLTAFLLVTAVWMNIAQITARPAGRSREGVHDCDAGDCVILSVLVSADDVWIGVSRVNDVERVPRTAAGYDWDRVEALLTAHKASAGFSDKTDIEIAAASTPDHPVDYRSLIAAMDVAVRAGFTDVGITDPAGLMMRPQR